MKSFKEPINCESIFFNLLPFIKTFIRNEILVRDRYSLVIYLLFEFIEVSTCNFLPGQFGYQSGRTYHLFELIFNFFVSFSYQLKMYYPSHDVILNNNRDKFSFSHMIITYHMESKNIK